MSLLLWHLEHSISFIFIYVSNWSVIVFFHCGTHYVFKAFFYSKAPLSNFGFCQRQWYDEVFKYSNPLVLKCYFALRWRKLIRFNLSSSSKLSTFCCLWLNKNIVLLCNRGWSGCCKDGTTFHVWNISRKKCGDKMALDMNQDLDEHLFSSLIIVIISSPSDMFFSEPDFFSRQRLFPTSKWTVSWKKPEILEAQNMFFFWGWELLINSLAYY